MRLGAYIGTIGLSASGARKKYLSAWFLALPQALGLSPSP